MRRAGWGGRSLGVVFVSFALGACATAPSHEAVIKFATATDATAENTRGAFAAVEQTGRLAEIEARDNDYLTQPAAVKLGPVKTQLTSDILEPRLKVLDALAGYASLLASLTSGEQQAAFDKNAKALGENLKTVKAGDFMIPPDAADGVAKAVTALGDFLIQQTLDRKLPPIIQRMDKTVSDLSDALIQDIGGAGDADGKGASGLRQLLRANLNLFRVARAKNLTDIAVSSDAAGSRAANRLELYQEYKRAVDETNKVEAVDASLAALQLAIGKMKLAHAALAAPDNPSTLQKVQSFASQAERLGKLVESLRKL